VSSLIERAAALAEAAHSGQVDKAGVPYIGHPARVAALVATRGGSDEAIAAAWLHDVVEDTTVILASIRYGFGDTVADLVDALTRRSGEALGAYYARVVRTPGAVLVKVCDVDDNSDPARLAQLPAADAARLARKYATARAILGDVNAAPVAP
jgi:hypothetical protein